MKDIYVEVITTPEVMVWNPVGTFLAGLDLRQGWYRAKWEGQEIIVAGTGTFLDTLPNVGSRGLISGQFEDQRFYDDNGKKLDMPYFFVGGGVE